MKVIQMKVIQMKSPNKIGNRTPTGSLLSPDETPVTGLDYIY